MREALRDPLVLSAHSAGTRIVTYGLWVALLFFVLVDFRLAKIKKEFRPSSTHFIRARRGNEDSDLRAERAT